MHFVAYLSAWSRRGVSLALTLFLFLPGYAVSAADSAVPTSVPAAQDSTADVMGAFSRIEIKPSDIVAVTDKEKRIVMFSMGVPLLVFILITAVLGVAMGVYGKRVYIPHMIFASLSVTLAIAHAVVGIVWFYPF